MAWFSHESMISPRGEDEDNSRSSGDDNDVDVDVDRSATPSRKKSGKRSEKEREKEREKEKEKEKEKRSKKRKEKEKEKEKGKRKGSRSKPGSKTNRSTGDGGGGGGIGGSGGGRGEAEEDGEEEAELEVEAAAEALEEWEISGGGGGQEEEKRRRKWEEKEQRRIANEEEGGVERLLRLYYSNDDQRGSKQTDEANAEEGGSGGKKSKSAPGGSNSADEKPQAKAEALAVPSATVDKTSPMSTPRLEEASAPDVGSDAATLAGADSGGKGEISAIASPREEGADNSAARRRELRRKVLEEIINTEETYVQDLQVMAKYYLIPAKKILPEEDVNAIFSNLPTLLHVNTEILSALQQRMNPAEGQPQQSDPLVADVFLANADYLKLYTTYTIGQADSLDTVSKLRQRNAAFKLFLEATQKKPQCRGLDLKAFLIKPVQRICKYPLLLRELLKYTEEGHPDYEALTAALAKVQNVAEHVNKHNQHAQNINKMVEIQQSLLGAKERIMLPGREFIKEGNIMKTSAKRRGRGGTPMRIFLFNDILILAKRSAFELVHIRQGKSNVAWIIITKSPKEKEDWITAINDSKSELQRKSYQKLVNAAQAAEVRRSRSFSASTSLAQTIQVFKERQKQDQDSSAAAPEAVDLLSPKAAEEKDSRTKLKLETWGTGGSKIRAVRTDVRGSKIGDKIVSPRDDSELTPAEKTESSAEGKEKKPKKERPRSTIMASPSAIRRKGSEQHLTPPSGSQTHSSMGSPPGSGELSIIEEREAEEPVPQSPRLVESPTITVQSANAAEKKADPAAVPAQEPANEIVKRVVEEQKVLRKRSTSFDVNAKPRPDLLPRKDMMPASKEAEEIGPAQKNKPAISKLALALDSSPRIGAKRGSRDIISPRPDSPRSARSLKFQDELEVAVIPVVPGDDPSPQEQASSSSDRSPLPSPGRSLPSSASATPPSSLSSSSSLSTSKTRLTDSSDTELLRKELADALAQIEVLKERNARLSERLVASGASLSTSSDATPSSPSSIGNALLIERLREEVAKERSKKKKWKAKCRELKRAQSNALGPSASASSPNLRKNKNDS